MTATALSSAYRSIFAKYSNPVRRRPIWLRTDRDKEFLNRTFQGMLKTDVIQFKVCRDTNLKCAIVERSHRTIRDKLYKYMTHRNTYRYIDLLQIFVSVYNDRIHSATGMEQSKVTDSDILTTCNKMRSKHSSIRRTAVRFSFGQHVRLSKKLKFARDGQQNCTTEIFRIRKFVRRIPRPVYEMRDLLGMHIGHFYTEELSPVHVTKNTTYAIDKIKEGPKRHSRISRTLERL